VLTAFPLLAVVASPAEWIDEVEAPDESGGIRPPIREYNVTNRGLVLRQRDLASSGPALERRLIALPWLNRAHDSGPGCVVHYSKFGRLASTSRDEH
jgi:hypothetical protein